MPNEPLPHIAVFPTDSPPISDAGPVIAAAPPPAPQRRTAADLFRLAQELHINQRDFVEAEKLYLTLLNRMPNNKDVLFMIGTLYAESDQNGLAIVFLERAIDRGAGGAVPWMNLGNAWKRENKYAEALQCYQEASLQPDAGATVWTNLATLYVNEGAPEKCIEYSERALALNPDDDVAAYNRSLGWLELGRFEEGFRDYHAFGIRSGNRRRRKDRGYVDSRGVEVPMWDGSPLGGTLVIYGEQGIGDEVMFASCIPDFGAVRLTDRNGACTIIECDARLGDLFKRSFPWATVYATTNAADPAWTRERVIDARIPMGSLPMFYRKRREDFPGAPWLTADAEKVRDYCGRLLRHDRRDRPAVGLAWIGGRKETRVELRSMDLKEWAPILEQPCTFVSLQYTPGAAEEAAQHGVTHWEEAVCPAHRLDSSYDETAALVSALDLVICVNSSITHLAGALGVETWTLTPSKPSWPFGLPEWCGDEFVWAKSVTQFRQKPEEPDWKPCIERVAAALRERVER